MSFCGELLAEVARENEYKGPIFGQDKHTYFVDDIKYLKVV